MTDTASATPQIKTPPGARANALIGAALNAPLRGRFLLLVRLGWWTLAATTILLFVLTIPSRYSQLVIEGAENSIALRELGLSDFVPLLLGVTDGITFLVYTIVGALIFARKSQEWIGLLASLTLITAVFAIVRPVDSFLFVDPPLRVPLLIVLALAASTIIIFVYIFPDGHFTPVWTRWIVVGLCGFALYGVIERIWLTQPFRWPPAPLSPVLFIGIFAGAIFQIYRYRRASDSVQRAQMKWVVLGLTIAAVGLVSFQVILPAVLPRVLLPGMTRTWYLIIGAPLFYLAMLQFPLSLAVSIFRYHLWDIDLIISRTLLYASLTAILAGLFAGMENIMQQLFILLTGQGSEIATVIATLVVVATFTPLKEAIHRVVERRFKDVSDPTERLKPFTDLVETRVTPLYAPQITRRMLVEAINAFDAKGGAAYLEHSNEMKLLQTTGDWDGEAAICLPIQNGDKGRRFGLIALDDRKSGSPYDDEDRRALEALMHKVARALEEDSLADSY